MIVYRDWKDLSNLLTNIKLVKPISINGSYIIRLTTINDNTPIYIQFPQCKIKPIVGKGKKNYADLIFTNENTELVEWSENFENLLIKTIYDNRAWFDGDLDENDVDSFFTPILRPIKSGQSYNLKVILPDHLAIYNENGKKMENDFKLDDCDVLTILELKGIKCSPKNFLLEIEIKQILILKTITLFETCLIERPSTSSIIEETHNPIPILEMNKDNLDEKVVSAEVKEETAPIDKTLSIDLDDLIPDDDSIIIKNRNEVYYKLYKEAREKAKQAKKDTLVAFLEAKRIKKEYMLDDDSDDSFDETFRNFE